MTDRFERDDHPGMPRILVIAHGESSHTQSWIDLLRDARLNVRLFSLPTGTPPADWKTRTYVTTPRTPPLDPSTRRSQVSPVRSIRAIQSVLSSVRYAGPRERTEQWLAEVIREWKPDVIHTIAVRTASELYYKVRTTYGLESIGRWVIQVLGGSDFTLEQLDPERAERIGRLMRDCDCLIADNECDYRDAIALGLDPQKRSPLGIVPTTGGLDLDEMIAGWPAPTSQRRLILMPKAYEFFQSKTLPVFEALRLAWGRIQPCRIVMLAAQPETIAWARALPKEIRDATEIHERVPRAAALEYMSRARVMLAPSLLDGTPNALLEAMAYGVLPIVSPIETISQLVHDRVNVLFARNLYPDEIAEALVIAMNDDRLVDRIAQENIELVRSVADRRSIRPKVIELYETLAGRNRS